MIYYVKTEGYNPVILGSTEDYESIPSGCIECTESQYYQYEELVNDNISKREAEQAYQTFLENLREQRRKVLVAFDTYKTNIFYNIEDEDLEDRSKIIEWYHKWLDLPSTATIDNYPLVIFPDTPIRIQRYL